MLFRFLGYALRFNRRSLLKEWPTVRKGTAIPHGMRRAAKPFYSRRTDCSLLTAYFLYKLFINLLLHFYADWRKLVLMRHVERRVATGGWEAFAAAFSFICGIMATLFGLLLNVITWILGSELHPWLRRLSTALFVLTIPLLIFAGYCLDWMERKLNAHPKKLSHYPS